MEFAMLKNRKHISPCTSIACLKKLWMAVPLVLSGCALSRGHVAIEYISPHGAEILEQASDIQVLVHVTDNREEKDIVGHKNNGYGMKAPIEATNSVEVLVL